MSSPCLRIVPDRHGSALVVPQAWLTPWLDSMPRKTCLIGGSVAAADPLPPPAPPPVPVPVSAGGVAGGPPPPPPPAGAGGGGGGGGRAPPPRTAATAAVGHRGRRGCGEREVHDDVARESLDAAGLGERPSHHAEGQHRQHCQRGHPRRRQREGERRARTGGRA